MQEEKKDLFSRLGENKKALTFIIVIGVIGILMIGVSEMMPSKGAKSKQEENMSVKDVSFDQQSYINALEEKVLELVTSINGVGNAKVMITLDSTFEYKYATTLESVKDFSDGNIDGSAGSKHESQKEEYVYIEDSSGRKQALLISQVLPRIKGVVVVCEGGDTLAVRNNVINAVTTALGVYSNNVYVTKMSSK